MFDPDAFYTLLEETTTAYRKGAAVKRSEAGPLEVIEINAMPPVDDFDESAGEDLIDVHFFFVGIKKALAVEKRAEFEAILRDWPSDLAVGPSYIALGGEVGSQDAALRFMGLGAALDYWKVFTPAFFGMTGKEADNAAGIGYVLIAPSAALYQVTKGKFPQNAKPEK